MADPMTAQQPSAPGVNVSAIANRLLTIANDLDTEDEATVQEELRRYALQILQGAQPSADDAPRPVAWAVRVPNGDLMWAFTAENKCDTHISTANKQAPRGWTKVPLYEAPPADARDAEIAAAHALLNTRGVQTDNHDTEADLTLPERIECLIAAHDEATTDLVDDLSDARDGNAGDAEDARRYRWLRDHASSARGEQPMVHMTDEDGCAIDRPGVVCPITDSSLDAAIDRAMGGES